MNGPIATFGETHTGNDMNNQKVITLAAEALRTDNAWTVELVKVFGKNAGDVRYLKAGQGFPGTPLNAAYLARTAAQEAWHNELLAGK